jgi:hypothetical protein
VEAYELAGLDDDPEDGVFAVDRNGLGVGVDAPAFGQTLSDDVGDRNWARVLKDVLALLNGDEDVLWLAVDEHVVPKGAGVLAFDVADDLVIAEALGWGCRRRRGQR